MNENHQRADFETLVERNRGRFAAIASCYSGANDREDLLQEILLQVWRSLISFKQRANIDTWCYRVALNTAISWRRRATRREADHPTEAAEISQVEGGMDGADEVLLLERFIRQLTNVDRAIVLMYLDDRPTTEIAEAMGISEGAVRVRVHRIKRRLADRERNEP